MKFELIWASCFWLLLPILAWNIIFGAKITLEKITSDTHSPAWLLGAENVFRLATFILPLLHRVKFDTTPGKSAWKFTSLACWFISFPGCRPCTRPNRVGV
jgi:hypothetical protein